MAASSREARAINLAMASPVVVLREHPCQVDGLVTIWDFLRGEPVLTWANAVTRCAR